VFNDVLVLRVADVSALAWETPTVKSTSSTPTLILLSLSERIALVCPVALSQIVGTPPSQRYCHSAVTIGHGGVTRSFVVFGGLDPQRSYLNDLHIATVSGSQRECCASLGAPVNVSST
jgi:hypothetical protein